MIEESLKMAEVRTRIKSDCISLIFQQKRTQFVSSVRQKLPTKRFIRIPQKRTRIRLAKQNLNATVFHGKKEGERYLSYFPGIHVPLCE